MVVAAKRRTRAEGGLAVPPACRTYDLTMSTADTISFGEVFTRRWVVELVLDAAGYTEERDLASLRAVEPSCGAGAFLLPMVERLIASARRHGRPLDALGDAIQAMDLQLANTDQCRHTVSRLLSDAGASDSTAASLAAAWVRAGDFLLSQPEHEGLFASTSAAPVDFVIGNPPYIRPEDVSPALYESYRRAFPTMLGRADVYIGFFEAALRALRPGGVVAFICADRWMRNQYGRGLRSLISSDYALDVVLSMHDVDAFDEQVSAYPAVVVIRNGAQGPVAVGEANRSFDTDDASRFVDWVRSGSPQHHTGSVTATRLSTWRGGSESWPGGSPELVAMVESLNDRFDPLQDPRTGTRVGIGVATGVDELFVTKDASLVEPSRLLPLAMARDGASGSIEWGGTYLVNPWEEDGSLVDLAHYPRLSRYFTDNGRALRARHVAGKSAAQWYRTIDKVDHSLVDRPKLLFPDMKMTTHPVLEPGGLYPHHNLYFVISDKWDLEVLGGLLLSKVAEAFVSAYCVKMRGGTLRFQAQYLRRVRVPSPDMLTACQQDQLRDSFVRRDVAQATRVAIEVYGIDDRWSDLLAC
jgi:adenine-specific DNA-methyltransferase